MLGVCLVLCTPHRIVLSSRPAVICCVMCPTGFSEQAIAAQQNFLAGELPSFSSVLERSYLYRTHIEGCLLIWEGNDRVGSHKRLRICRGCDSTNYNDFWSCVFVLDDSSPTMRAARSLKHQNVYAIRTFPDPNASGLSKQLFSLS